MQPKAVRGLSAGMFAARALAVTAHLSACALGCESAGRGSAQGQGGQAAGGEPHDDSGGAGGNGEGMGGEGTAGHSAAGGASGQIVDAAVTPPSDAALTPKADGGGADPIIPAGLVPVVVALGPGGRTAVSCNGGRAFRVNSFHKTPDDDHSANAVTGMAGGFGAVVISAGWGAPGRIFYSDNAVDWQELPAAQFTKLNGTIGPSTENTSGAFFDGTLFKVFWSHTLWSSADGKAWKETAWRPSNISHVRDVEFNPESQLLVVRVERDENGGRNFLMATSTDLGKTYKIWSPRTTGCAGFEWGPVASSHGVIVAGGSAGMVCRSEDGGATWAEASTAGGVNAMFADRAAFYLARGNDLFRSLDGRAWTRVLQANAQISAGVWSAQTGHTVAASANGTLKFFRSDDGQAWTPSANLVGTSFGVRRMRVAFVKPHPQCPGL